MLDSPSHPTHCSEKAFHQRLGYPDHSKGPGRGFGMILLLVYDTLSSRLPPPACTQLLPVHAVSPTMLCLIRKCLHIHPNNARSRMFEAPL